jgi:hypothetical protein
MKIFNFFLILKTVYSCFDQNQVSNNSSLIVYKNDVYDISNYNGTLNFTNDFFSKMKVGVLCKDDYTVPTSFNETTKRPRKTKTTTQRIVTTIIANDTTTQKLTTTTTLPSTNETTLTTLSPSSETTSTKTMDEYQILLNDSKRIVSNNMMIMIGCLSYILLF